MSKVEKFPPQFNDPSDRDDQDPETKKKTDWNSSPMSERNYHVRP